MAKNPEITIKMENGEEIKIELYPEIAPNTVRNFIELVEDEYYDGLKFHRVIKGFMIQGGCPDGTGIGNPGYSIRGEFTENGYDNDLSHKRGVISMARSSHPDSAGSQFFIVHRDAPHLDGKYAAFGEVIEGMDFVDQIAEVETGASDMPREDQIMESMEVETSGEEYQAAEKL
ncbi:peptidyl-prolyl cis-trans isomerase B (cyclophilin B) [Halanaerobium saccharolyticum]|uniref:Peptidyl-prolyl cis-trans isomerase n=1 Tax=Halanaerobium saccharolyticum TaxID=43595 RepID=A0A4R6LU32_9FIRM|nr:peptidylprolyl isomerase [Halanaerobium saccharolyticum]TDO92208.1 peptidyl-prolyl cis-trans isomerase B (cyclophilin B) [Halanaerobium saccharolyticum]